jgi:hypothetical protein
MGATLPAGECYWEQSVDHHQRWLGVLDHRAPSDPMDVVDIAPDTIPPLLPGLRGTGGARRQSPTFSVVLPGRSEVEG